MAYPVPRNHGVDSTASMEEFDPSLDLESFSSGHSHGDIVGQEDTSASQEKDVAASQPADYRRSHRPTRPHIWLKDFVITNNKKSEQTGCRYPISDAVNYTGLSAQYQKFLCNFSATTIKSATYSEATKLHQWVDAMKAKIHALEENKTWEVVPLPQGKKAISCRWVIKSSTRQMKT